MVDSINLAKEKLGFEIFANLNIVFNENNEKGYLKVEKNNSDVKITYSEKCMLFRALTILKEHKNENSFNIELKKRFEKNGYMIDCSRNGVFNLDILKDTILCQALMGQNRLLLYTEDTYKLDNYPWFGYLRGGYTKEEIKEVVDFGEEFGVELIPCIQTLGHLGRPLHWEPMIPLRDGPSTLLIDNEDVYKLIEEMIKFSRECFHTNEIHIGMDESTEIGLGRYLGQHKFTDRIELFSKHLDRVIGICKKYDFIPMIWSDMYFRLNNKDEEYYRDTPLPQSSIDMIPKGVELVYWDYYHDKKEIYDNMNDFHFQCNRPVIFAGGAWRWKGYTPAIRKSLDYSNEALMSCVEKGINFVFVTAWGDNGNECTIYAALPVIAQYSVFDYYGVSDEQKIDSLLKAVTGESLERMLLLDLPDEPDNRVLCPQYNPSKYFLFQDPFNGIFDLQVKDQFAQNYKKHSLTLEKAAKESKDFGYIYETLSLLCKVLEKKVDLGVRLRKAYKANDKETLKLIVKEIPYIISCLDELNEAHRIQWNKENKSFGFDVCDGRIGYTKNRLLSVSKIIDEYLSGKLEKIEELETDILPYNGHDYEVCWNWWLTTVTVHNL